MTELSAGLFQYIVTETNATNAFIEILRTEGYNKETLLQFQTERYARGQELLSMIRHEAAKLGGQQ